MTVYVVYHYWDTPDVGGTEVLGVFASFEDARALIEKSAAKIRAEFDDDIWEEDMTWDEPSSIHLGGYEQGYLEPATIYSWDIDEQEIQ